ncbi:macrophage mannose receptor 1-like [Cyclopterus lumpus]|uniref:macrophage mannose receptor 1-like n=1 Tax=Cyclopterus lumpus TaxID=8103 RepID=UPI0014869E06|nr:macrophage mannose receptor 1-like [Cyclopterus lumpus]
MDSWWRIDLRGVYTIDNITINQKSSHNTDLNSAKIYIGNSREKNGTANRLCTSIKDIQYPKPKSFHCDELLSGRFITVSLPGTHFLALCEVKIYGTEKKSTFELIRINKTWVDALDYCRARGTTLASIVDEDTQTWAELQASNSNSPFVWLGLRYTCTLDFWFWVENLPVTFRHWAPNGTIDDCDMSGAMEKHENHLWFSKSAASAFNFLCIK